MCGICGLVTLSGAVAESGTRQKINQMVDALMHRGPDENGIDGDQSAVFGMTRLAIRGLADGKQPIVDESSGVMMACNGEIDNHVELREWLRNRGKIVEQSTDVAVILPLYLELDVGFVERLKGAFAIAIWDPREKKLLLIRDRAGERPLFYSNNNGIVTFASLIAAFASAESHVGSLNINAIHGYLQSGYFVAPKTPFKDIQKVFPGEIVTITRMGVQQRRYWRWNAAKTVKQNSSLDTFDEIFREAVRRQSAVDVNFGLFLSGGLDSSLIAAVTRSIHPDKTLSAYSLRFSEASYDEGDFAEQVASALGIEFNPVWVRPADFPVMVANLVRTVGEPLADPAWIPTALLAKRAAQDVSVALVGEGADELFAGYPTCFGAGLAEYYARIPKSLRTLIRHAVERWPASDKKVSINFLLKRFVQGDGLDYLARHIVWTSYMPSDIMTRLGLTPSSLLQSDKFSAEMLDRIQQYDLETSLAEGLLTKADRASMNSALELRAPFLDEDVMDFAASLPIVERVRRLQTKVFLKRYALRYLPREIVHRKKRGLSVPLSSWLRETVLYEWADAKLSSPHLARVGVNQVAARNLLQEHTQRKADHARAIWTLSVLSEWLDWVSEIEDS